MKTSSFTSFVAAILFIASGSVLSADIVDLMPTGNGGFGLLGSNITNPGAPTTPGSGGVGGSGITFDTVNNILHVDIEWGSENGYTDMSGEVTLLHLHGLTADPAPNSFDQVTMNILVNMGNSVNFDSSPTGGGIVDEFFISNQDVAGLLEGRVYINVHTALNPTGEIRGYLVQAVPEPGTAGIMVLFAGWALRRRR